MSWSQKWQENGGIIGWAEKNRGKLGVIAGIPLGYVIREAMIKVPVYFDRVTERYAIRQGELISATIIKTLQESGYIPKTTGNPGLEVQLDPESIYRGVEALSSKVSELVQDISYLKREVEKLKSEK